MNRLFLAFSAVLATCQLASENLDSPEMIFPGQIEVSIPFAPYHSASRKTFLCVWPDGEVWIPSYPLATSKGQFSRYTSNLVQLPPLQLGYDPLAPYLILPDGTMLVNLLAPRSSELPALHQLSRNGSILRRFATDGLVMALSSQADGKILLGGTFTLIDGHARDKIARLHSDLEIDPDFNIGIGPYGPFPSKIAAIEVRPSGEIYIGGNFHYIGLESRNGIARLLTNGTLDLSFNAGDALFIRDSTKNVTVEFVIETGSRVYAYAAPLQDPSYKFARLHLDGANDTSWNSPYWYVPAMLKQKDGKLIIASDTLNIQELKRFHTNGTVDSLFRNFPTNYHPRYLALDSTDTLFVSGFYFTRNGSVQFTARLFSDKTASLPPLNLALLRTDGSVNVQVSGPSDVNVLLETSGNLSNWLYERTLFLANGSSFHAVTNASGGSRFFRGILK